MLCGGAVATGMGDYHENSLAAPLFVMPAQAASTSPPLDSGLRRKDGGGTLPFSSPLYGLRKAMLSFHPNLI